MRQVSKSLITAALQHIDLMALITTLFSKSSDSPSPEDFLNCCIKDLPNARYTSFSFVFGGGLKSILDYFRTPHSFFIPISCRLAFASYLSLLFSPRIPDGPLGLGFLSYNQKAPSSLYNDIDQCNESLGSLRPDTPSDLAPSSPHHPIAMMAEHALRLGTLDFLLEILTIPPCHPHQHRIALSCASDFPRAASTGPPDAPVWSAGMVPPPLDTPWVHTPPTAIPHCGFGRSPP